jgi:hypothetical protein
MRRRRLAASTALVALVCPTSIVFRRISIAARTVISGAAGPAPALVARRLLALNRSEALRCSASRVLVWSRRAEECAREYHRQAQ